jgi:hypothetical protein
LFSREVGERRAFRELSIGFGVIFGQKGKKAKDQFNFDHNISSARCSAARAS